MFMRVIFTDKQQAAQAELKKREDERKGTCACGVVVCSYQVVLCSGGGGLACACGRYSSGRHSTPQIRTEPCSVISSSRRRHRQAAARTTRGEFCETIGCGG